MYNIGIIGLGLMGGSLAKAFSKIDEVNKIIAYASLTHSPITIELAENIIKYRNNSKFKSIEDILNVDGIGQAKYEKIKEYICI